MSETTIPTPNNAIAAQVTYESDELRAIQSFDDAIALANAVQPVIVAEQEIGDGFALLKNKDRLIGVPLLFLTWRFNDGKYEEKFVTAYVVTNRNEKFIINDGSTGICQQLRELSNKGRNGNMLSRHGLSRSDYPYADEQGEMKEATTYYIDTSA